MLGVRLGRLLVKNLSEQKEKEGFFRIKKSGYVTLNSLPRELNSLPSK